MRSGRWLLLLVIGGALWFSVQMYRLVASYDSAPKNKPSLKKTSPIKTPTQPAKVPHDNRLAVSRISRNDVFYTIVSPDLTRATLGLYWKTPDGRRLSTLKEAEVYSQNDRRKILFATNAGIFDMKYTPLGLHVENGKTLVPLNLKSASGNFYIKPNGVFLFDDAAGASILESTRYNQLKPTPQIATQSGPLLVYGNKVNPSLKPNKTNLHIRSAIAVESPWKVKFVISEKPVSLHEMAVFCKEDIQCPDALYLDGAISQFHFPGMTQAAQGHFAGILAITTKE